MKTYKFKTNIKCSGCIEKVTPFLNGEKSINSWKVNTEIAEKILTVESTENDSEKIKIAIKKAGYTIEEIKE